MRVVPVERLFPIVLILAAGAATHAQTSGAAPAPSDPPAISAKQDVSGRAAWEKVVGNTIVGTVDGKPFVEFYARDGVLKFRFEGKLSVGRWQLDGELVCFEYPGDPKECFQLTLTDGTNVTWTDNKGVIDTRGTLAQGNSENL